MGCGSQVRVKLAVSVCHRHPHEKQLTREQDDGVATEKHLWAMTGAFFVLKKLPVANCIMPHFTPFPLERWKWTTFGTHKKRLREANAISVDHMARFRIRLFNRRCLYQRSIRYAHKIDPVSPRTWLASRGASRSESPCLPDCHTSVTTRLLSPRSSSCRLADVIKRKPARFRVASSFPEGVTSSEWYVLAAGLQRPPGREHDSGSRTVTARTMANSSICFT
jgi:hypothetical protein